MTMTPAITEAIRRRQGSVPSGAGIPGGQPVANNNLPGNPIGQAGMSPVEAPTGAQALPPNPTQENPMKGAISALDEAKAGQSKMIIRSLTKQLDRLNPDPNPPQKTLTQQVT